MLMNKCSQCWQSKCICVRPSKCGGHSCGCLPPSSRESSPPGLRSSPSNPRRFSTSSAQATTQSMRSVASTLSRRNPHILTLTKPLPGAVSIPPPRSVPSSPTRRSVFPVGPSAASVPSSPTRQWSVGREDSQTRTVPRREPPLGSERRDPFTSWNPSSTVRPQSVSNDGPRIVPRRSPDPNVLKFLAQNSSVSARSSPSRTSSPGRSLPMGTIAPPPSMATSPRRSSLVGSVSSPVNSIAPSPPISSVQRSSLLGGSLDRGNAPPVFDVPSSSVRGRPMNSGLSLPSRFSSPGF
jgi:hypothetical protein